MNRLSVIAIACAANATAVWGLTSLPANAACVDKPCTPDVTNSPLVTLQDDNSVAKFDLGADWGLYDWLVDGTDHMYQEWFWYRMGDSGPEYSLDTLNLVNYQTSDTNFSPGDDTLVALYEKPNVFQVQVTWSLDGGSNGSGASDLGEQISITNLTKDSLNLNFFEYTDFDLSETIWNDTVEFGGNGKVQWFTQTDPVTQSGVTEIALSPPPALHEANEFSITVDDLNDDFTTTLNNNPGPLGPLDATATWQWQFNIAGNDTVQISKDKQINAAVPEPLTILGSAVALGFGVAFKKEHSRKQKNIH